ncbi:MAG TPA: hypothetical protein VFE50_09565 [Cyclobacteriaceae bacterium]|nr:hypothetical protein [Cyclobacteriaceae bacterium]
MDKSTEFARVIDWSPPWDVGAPMPQVFSNGNKTFLVYMINEPDPKWDGTYVNVIDNTSQDAYPLALVEFIRPDTHRFGTVNDEAGEGHPLAEKGLEYYSAHIVENSTWIAELKAIHKVHPYFKESSWSDKKHYLLFFHDEMFEIVARDFKIETFRSTFLELSMETARRINS